MNNSYDYYIRRYGNSLHANSQAFYITIFLAIALALMFIAHLHGSIRFSDNVALKSLQYLLGWASLAFLILSTWYFIKSIIPANVWMMPPSEILRDLEKETTPAAFDNYLKDKLVTCTEHNEIQQDIKSTYLYKAFFAMTISISTLVILFFIDQFVK